MCASPQHNHWLLAYLRDLVHTERSDRANRHLARYLTFMAGAANAGGFLAVHQYTSHMSGVVSAMAANLAVGEFHLVGIGLLALISFLSGSITTTVLIRIAREHRLRSQYALPLALESLMFASFCLTVRHLREHNIAATIGILCLSMGLQNAMITKLSGHVIRTTHLTGMVTDIGICCGRLLLPGIGNKDIDRTQEIRTLRLLGSLVGLFFLGGVMGAVGFEHVGFGFMLPISGSLLLLSLLPILDDLT
jgi:uncharacterized membrane protein YoaK (UPF0700 family)